MKRVYKIMSFLCIFAVVLVALALCFSSCSSDPCKNGHTMEDIVIKEPTCMQSGSLYKKCSVCGYSYDKPEPMNPVDHKYENGICVTCGVSPEIGNFYFEKNAAGDSYTLVGFDARRNLETTVRVEIPEKYCGLPVTAIGEKAFYQEENVSEIILPPSVVVIGEDAFEGCKSLSSFVIPKNVTEIGDGTFFNCKSLKSIDIPQSVTKIGKGAFAQCSALTDLTLPDAITEIGEAAFGSCDSLTYVELPAGVTKIEQRTFLNCKSLEGVRALGSITSIGEIAFDGCYSLTYFSAKGEPALEKEAFSGCYRLYDFDVPDGVSYIGEMAFEGCTKLYSLTLAKSLTDIGENVFGQYGEISRLKLVKNLSSLDISFSSNNKGGLLRNGTLVVRDDKGYAIEKINDFIVFMTITNYPEENREERQCFILGYIGDEIEPEFPKFESEDYTVTNYVIDSHAFDGRTSIIFANLPDGLTAINEYAFNSASNLKRIYIPHSVSWIADAFYINCDGLVEILDQSNTEKLSYKNSIYKPYDLFHYEDIRSTDKKPLEYSQITVEGDFIFLTVSRVRYVLGYIGSDSVVTVPSLPEDSDIVEYVLYDCALRSFSCNEIIIPEGITHMGRASVVSIAGIITVNIPKSVVTIDDRVIANCGTLKNIVYGGTKAEWKALNSEDKVVDSYHVGEYSVECADGVIKMKGHVVISE